MKKIILFTSLFLGISLSVFSQHSRFYDSDDAKERGYYTRPYLRYEAEPDSCTTNDPANFLLKSYDQSNDQCEASNQTAIKLSNVNDFVSWEATEEANALVLRFSIPDNDEGTGTKGTISLYVDDVFVDKIDLDSYWAWQYFTGENVPYNEPKTNAVIRMRYDEVSFLFSPGSSIPAEGIVKLQIDADDYSEGVIVDFIELENVAPVNYEDIPGTDGVDKFKYEAGVVSGDVTYVGDGSDLINFINDNNHRSHIIYIPPGKYTIPNKMTIHTTQTQVIGAGMWYTELYFPADPTSSTEYNRRGVESGATAVRLEGVKLTTKNNIRYYNRDSGKQVGKGIMGSWGKNSVIKNVWVEHFECGAWINSSENLQISDCRFRNNYADGINLSGISKNCVVDNCSFRNNGDDDMATWSNTTYDYATNNTFIHCISENCWRAAGIGFFGGSGNKAEKCIVKDPMEVGLRLDAVFRGYGYGDQFSEFNDIVVYGGGTNKNIYNGTYGAITISVMRHSSTPYAVKNVSFKNIELIDSKQDGIYIYGGATALYPVSICMENITIDGTKIIGTGNGGYGLNIATGSLQGNIFYKNITFENIALSDIKNSSNPTYFTLKSTTEDPCDELPVGINDIENDEDNNGIKISSSNKELNITGLTTGETISVYNLVGSKIHQTSATKEAETISGFNTGVYIVVIGNNAPQKVVVQ